MIIENVLYPYVYMNDNGKIIRAHVDEFLNTPVKKALVISENGKYKTAGSDNGDCVGGSCPIR